MKKSCQEETCQKKIGQEKICQKYLRQLTIAHAIPRIIECFVLKQFDLKPPVLDLGCGEGAFAQICLGKGKIDVGLDTDSRVAELAKKSGVYKKVVVANANKIPFQNNFFKTIISNSVLEHIEDLNSVFQEVHRVLDKRGRFIFLVPDKTASDYFFYAELLEKVKLKGLAKAYIKAKHKLYRYAHLENKKFWEKTARQNGFVIKQVKGLISPQTVRLVDFFSPLALPDYFLRRFFARSFIFRPRFIAKAMTLYLLSYCQPVNESKATGWYFELEKK